MNEKKKKIKLIYKIIYLLVLISSCFSIYEILLLNSIEDVIRYIIIGIIIFINLLLLIKLFSTRKRKKKRLGFVIFMILFTLTNLLIGGVIYYLYGQVSNMNKKTITYSSSLVTMKKNETSSIDDINDFKIGLLNDKKSPDGYIIPQEIIKDNKLDRDNKIKKYEDYSTMITDLYEDKIDAIFISTNYVSMFESISGYENIEHDTKIIISKEKKFEKSYTSKQETESSGKSINEPFTLLLMGIDSTDEVLTKDAIANGDTLILITFNPKTLNATMLSIPRDSYVPISCWSDKAENKITHAAAYGTDCMMQTIEDYFDINIDYYAKINFKGLVKLVDAVGGVEVEVPKDLCTDNSNREEVVCIHEGVQTLNGEEALVFARNRKQLAEGDFGRAKHQQEIVKALVNKIKTIRDISTFTKLLNTISNSMDTNLTTKQILSFYNVGKDIINRSLSADEAELINIQQLYLDGTGQMIYDEKMRMVLWDYVPNKTSKKDIKNAMKENLKTKDYKMIKNFSFSINEPYEKEVIGKGPYKNSSTYTLIPNFIGDSEAQARAAASRLGIKVVFRGSGYVTAQSIPANRRIDKLGGTAVVLTLGNGKTKTVEEKDTTKKSDDEVITTEKKTDATTTNTTPTTSTTTDENSNAQSQNPDDDNPKQKQEDPPTPDPGPSNPTITPEPTTNDIPKETP